MLRLEIIGKLGADAQVKSHNGSEFVSFNVAHNRNRVDNETGEVVRQDVVWVMCALNGNGGNLLQFLRKGTLVCCSGSPRFGIYRREGNVFVDVQLSVDSIQLLPKPITKEQESHLDLFYKSVEHLKSLGYESFEEVVPKPAQ